MMMLRYLPSRFYYVSLIILSHAIHATPCMCTFVFPLQSTVFPRFVETPMIAGVADRRTFPLIAGTQQQLHMRAMSWCVTVIMVASGVWPEPTALLNKLRYWFVFTLHRCTGGSSRCVYTQPASLAAPTMTCRQDNAGGDCGVKDRGWHRMRAAQYLLPRGAELMHGASLTAMLTPVSCCHAPFSCGM